MRIYFPVFICQHTRQQHRCTGMIIQQYRLNLRNRHIAYQKHRINLAIGADAIIGDHFVLLQFRKHSNGHKADIYQSLF